MIAAPPLEAGAVQDTLAVLSPGSLAVTWVGALGFVRGMTALL